MLEGGVDLAGVNGAAALHELQHRLCLGPPRSRPFGARRSRMHQALRGPRQDAVVDEEVFFDGESRVACFEVAGSVIVDAMAEREVLRPGWRRIGSTWTKPSLAMARGKVVGLKRLRAIA